MSVRSAQDIIRLLAEKRGIANLEAFVQPDFARDTHDGRLLKDVGAAAKRLAAAIRSKEKIVLFGDYDADGIPATALVTRVLRNFGADPLPLIPARADGYGLTPPAVTAILDLRPDLLVTLDNGTVSRDEVARLADAGIDVIIIDHHEPQPGHVANRALAIVNPKQSDCFYPFKELCACAVAWKVMSVLAEELDQDPAFLKWHLDLVALSTVADMMPLIGENRVLVQFGLRVFAKTRNAGLRALAAVSGTEAALISASDLGFRIGPRLNAPSRMHQEAHENGNYALDLLLSDDEEMAHRFASYLNARNSDRQALLEQHLEAAREQAEKQMSAPVIVAWSAEWSTGVIGLVASRLTEQYGRPSVVLAQESGVWKGSIRSVGDISALNLMEAAAECLERFGGHQKAGGLTLREEATPETFSKLICQSNVVANVDWTAVAASTRRQPDLEISLAELTVELAEAVRGLEPFGLGFPAPLFAVEGRFTRQRLVGRTSAHRVGFLADAQDQRKAVWFRAPEDVPGEEEKRLWCVNVEEDGWNGIRSAQAVIRGVEA